MIVETCTFFVGVAGLGLVTPLGAGVQVSWDRLIALKTGVQALSAESLRLKDPGLLQQLPSRVAALVPRGSAAGDFDVEKWLVRILPQFVTFFEEFQYMKRFFQLLKFLILVAEFDQPSFHSLRTMCC